MVLEESRGEDRAKDRIGDGIEDRPPSRLESLLKEIGAQVAQCLLRGDSSALGELLHEGFVLRMPDGERISKDQLLDLVATRQMRYDSMAVEFGGVQVYDGQIAFLSGHCQSDKHFRGRRIAGRYPLTALYVCRNGNWQLVAIHHMEVSEGLGAAAKRSQ